MNNGSVSNADYEEVDHAKKYIQQFEDHGMQAQALYDSFKGVFDLSVLKTKNSLTMNGGLRDLSEAAKSLSSIRGDAIAATSHAFNATMKIADHKLKVVKAEDDSDEANSSALLMRQLTEQLQSQNTNPAARKARSITNNGGTTSSNDDFELQRRITTGIKTGKINVNVNELSMKHDFNGVQYRFEDSSQQVVVLDSNGKKIENYPIERIPDAFAFKRFENGVPMDGRGMEIKPYNG